MKNTMATWLTLIGGLLTAAAAPAGDIAAGKDKTFTCVGCHGAPNVDNVYPTYRAPKIGGQAAVYIVAALQAYAAGDRWHPTMQAQARSLSAEDMADIAAYLESLGN